MAKDVENRIHVALASAEILEARVAALRELVPEAAGEQGIDWDRLRAGFGEAVDERPDRYRFEWAGKRDAIATLQRSSSATLVPVPNESMNFDATRHVFIEGENLEVLKLLYKPYAGRVKMIYIDPPYNTGNDFVYRDDYARPLAAYLEQTGQVEARPADVRGEAERANRAGRIHSDWLSMMYPRLFLARQMLREDGVIFVSIDDNEVHHLRMVINEIFGEENFIASVVWQKRTSPDTRAILGAAHDYIIVYARSLPTAKQSFGALPLSAEREAEYRNPDNDPRGSWASVDLTGQVGHATPDQFYDVVTPGGVVYPPPDGRCWALTERKFKALQAEGKLWFGKDGNARPRLKLFLSEVEGMAAWTWWTKEEVGHNQEATKEFNELMGEEGLFDNPKPTRLVRRMLQLATKSDDPSIVMDFFAGSCTTADAVLQMNHEDGGNRRFVMIQLPEPTPEGSRARDRGYLSIAKIGQTRIAKAIARTKADSSGQLPLTSAGGPGQEEDLGFAVYRLTQSLFRGWPENEAEAAATYVERLELFMDPLRDGWEALDVIAEVAIKEAGFGLNAKVERVDKVTGNVVYRVTDRDRGQHFHICLDDQLDPQTSKALGLHGDTDLFVCRDVAVDDTLAANLALQCRLRT